MTDLLIVDDSPLVEQVDTEYEEDAEGEKEQPDEVDEEEELDGEVTQSVATDDRASADYSLPEENRDVWKNFGYGSEAGRALRKLYAGSSKDAAARVSYPRMVSPARKWEPQAAPQKACPQRAHIPVPKSVRPRLDRDDPKNWYVPAPGRKPASEILAELDSYKPTRPKLVPGRDQGAEKRGLQDKFRYAGGNAMPIGAMGHVPKGEVPDIAACRQVKIERWDHIDESGLTKEQRGIFSDLTSAVQDKQNRLKELDVQDNADPKPGKAKTQRNREALQLQNDIQSHVRDIDRLLEISEE